MAAKKKWLISSLRKLANEDEDALYRLGEKYGLEVETPTGRKKRKDALIKAINAAFKEQGYKPVPRAKKEAPAEEEEDAPAPKRKKKSTAKKKVAAKKKPAKAGSLKGTGSLVHFIGLITLVRSVEKEMRRGLRTMTDSALGRVAEMTGHGDRSELNELVSALYEDESELLVAAQKVGVLDQDTLLDALVRIGTIGSDDDEE